LNAAGIGRTRRSWRIADETRCPVLDPIGVNLRPGWFDNFVFGAVRADIVWRGLLWASARA
jgi:hypothetical protein